MISIYKKALDPIEKIMEVVSLKRKINIKRNIFKILKSDFKYYLFSKLAFFYIFALANPSFNTTIEN